MTCKIITAGFVLVFREGISDFSVFNDNEPKFDYRKSVKNIGAILYFT